MNKHFRDDRLTRIRQRLVRSANHEYAAFHKAYHKSSKSFYGVKSPQVTDICNSIFPKKEKLSKDEALELIDQLWASDWFEEQSIGLILLERMAQKLVPSDLPNIKRIISECEGWAMLDWVSTKVLGALAINYPESIYPKVRTWTKSKHLWTRRASILIHILPARKSKLNSAFVLSTFAMLLHEKEFFIRKAIGWTLREIGKHYPEVTFSFLKEHRAITSGLTMREGSRNLPSSLQKELRRVL